MKALTVPRPRTKRSEASPTLGFLYRPFAEDLHADDPFAGALCISSSCGDDLVGPLVIHDQPFGVDPRQVDLDERVLGGRAERIHAVAARAVGAG